ncbi:opacity protein-like surface antigen [Salinibacter ruber]|uniref:Opacity protein-like surface antigen n=1 Tax=Salinibacter ruber TaxID=146919 RepID=A0A9X2TG14_9BACT|nr:porin family protein [Salinibacter ruber]MCS3678002.1 opacity protein-like surface antigen [Salinibacter ruber]MCS3681289.1 opacity protein-like surface antigen [Salinibacter ruber]
MRQTAALLIVLGLVFSTRVSAQPAVSVRGNVGAAFFQSPEFPNTVLNSGVDLGIETGVEVYDGLEVVLQGNFDRFTQNGDTYALLRNTDTDVSVEEEVEGGALNVLNGTVGLRYTLKNQSDAHPYVAGGVGLYRIMFAETRDPQGDDLEELSPTKRGFHVAVGANFQIDETYGVFFEPRYIVINTDGSDLRTRTTTRYVTVRLGVEVQF